MARFFNETKQHSLPALPVFQLVGGSEDVRREFSNCLKGELERHSLRATFLEPEACSNQYSLYSQLKLYDLVIVGGDVEFPTQKIYLDGAGQSATEHLVWNSTDSKEMQRLMANLIEKLNQIANQMPVWACVLIGGKSSRMGQPKHLIKDNYGRTWLERTVSILNPMVNGLVVSGNGNLPQEMASTPRLPDIPGIVGPLTGVLAATRWHPMVTWLVVACDMPYISIDAVQWLLSGRRAGCWGRVPRLNDKEHCEPLFAWYDIRAAHLFEDQVNRGNLRIGGVASHPKVENPIIPEALRQAWQNINRPEQLVP